MSNSTAIRLVGLDFGSTTTSGVVARATPRGRADRRSELTDVAIEYRSVPVFTPFRGPRIDERGLADWLDEWSRESGVAGHDVTGGAIVTGLAAQTENARVVRQLVQARFGPALIATADDPALESWLAFMANCRELSLAEPAVRFLNFDIGGGTTNVALGQAGDVQAVGCYRLGARHIRVDAGTYRIVGMSDTGRRLLDDLGIDKRAGDVLDTAEVAAVVDSVVGALEAVVEGTIRERFGHAADHFEEVAFDARVESPVITFSGGVGELVYRAAAGEKLPGTTAFGDLGIDIAMRIGRSPLLTRSLASHAPTALGRATALGLAIHHVELSGATLFLPAAGLLPLAELPIVGRLSQHATLDDIAAALRLIGHSQAGGCIAVALDDSRLETVRSLGKRLATALEAARLPAQRPLVLLVNRNAGKILGHYATRWGHLPVTLVVLDELSDRGAAYVTVGRPHDQLVPVSFYGFAGGAGRLP
ncbi:MAG TPA: ethanolamine ammonia-lyase reactivating factor EutA [Pirellulales bacterium]|nr:ethanolamine ammonia-lyase reactivating factor EutA [Pirellulales bacterium]